MRKKELRIVDVDYEDEVILTKPTKWMTDRREIRSFLLRRSRRGLVWSKVIRLRVGQPTTSSLPRNSSHPKELCSVLTRPDTGIGGNFVQRVLIKASKEPVRLS